MTFLKNVTEMCKAEKDVIYTKSFCLQNGAKRHFAKLSRSAFVEIKEMSVHPQPLNKWKCGDLDVEKFYDSE